MSGALLQWASNSPPSSRTGGVFSVSEGLQVAADLRTTVVIDYQNVHLVGHAAFDKHLPKHETLVDPALYAGQLVSERNRRQREGYARAVLAKVLVYRGEPSAEHDPNDYARGQRQKSHWQRDARVQVTLRPLKYEYQRDAQGRPATLHNGSDRDRQAREGCRRPLRVGRRAGGARPRHRLDRSGVFRLQVRTGGHGPGNASPSTTFCRRASNLAPERAPQFLSDEEQLR